MKFFGLRWFNHFKTVDASTVADVLCSVCWCDFREKREGDEGEHRNVFTSCRHHFDHGCLLDSLFAKDRFPYLCPYGRQDIMKVALENAASLAPHVATITLSETQSENFKFEMTFL